MAKQNTDTKEWSDEELKEYLKQEGRRIGYLLNKVKIPQQAKEELIDMIGYMTTSQLLEFSEILEWQYLDKKTEHIDKKYGEKIKEAYENRKEKGKEIDQEFIDHLEELGVDYKLEDL